MPAPIPQNCTWVGGVSPADREPALKAGCSMTDIDPEELEAAIRFVESIADMDRAEFGPDDWERAKLTAAAARVTLATLPRWEEVEVVRWAVIDEDGDSIGVFLKEEDAKFRVAQRERLFVVRLTGTAKVKVTP